jgi:hypothetical protein
MYKNRSCIFMKQIFPFWFALCDQCCGSGSDRILNCQVRSVYTPDHWTGTNPTETKVCTFHKNVIPYMKVVKFSADPRNFNVRYLCIWKPPESFRNLALHAVPYGTRNLITYSYNLSFFLLGRFSGWIRNNMEY